VLGEQEAVRPSKKWEEKSLRELEAQVCLTYTCEMVFVKQQC